MLAPISRRAGGTSIVSGQRGRLAAGGLVAAYFALLVGQGGYSSWSRLGVPPLRTLAGLKFADLRSVTSAWDCARRGIAVLPVNPCDPWKRPANYPRLWLLPGILGLGQRSTVVLGFVLAAVFFVAALAVVPKRSNVWQGALFGLALVSPAVMLGVQRGNVDMGLFALVALAVFAFRRPLGDVAAPFLLLLCAVLKFFPVLAVGFIFRRTGWRARLGGIVVIAGLGVFVIATLGYTRQIFKAVPQVNAYSYGVRRFSEWVMFGVKSVSPRLVASVTNTLSIRAWDVGVVLLVVALALIVRTPLRVSLTRRRPLGEREFDLFWAGACIYVGSYAVFRSWDYRLAFVLLTVPQLLRWATAGSWVAVGTLTALFGVLWLEPAWNGVPVIGSASSHWASLTRAPFHHQLPIAVLTQLVLFAGLTALLLATLPPVRLRVPIAYQRSREAEGS